MSFLRWAANQQKIQKKYWSLTLLLSVKFWYNSNIEYYFLEYSLKNVIDFLLSVNLLKGKSINFLYRIAFQCEEKLHFF